MDLSVSVIFEPTSLFSICTNAGRTRHQNGVSEAGNVSVGGPVYIRVMESLRTRGDVAPLFFAAADVHDAPIDALEENKNEMIESKIEFKKWKAERPNLFMIPFCNLLNLSRPNK